MGGLLVGSLGTDAIVQQPSDSLRQNQTWSLRVSYQPPLTHEWANGGWYEAWYGAPRIDRGETSERAFRVLSAAVPASTDEKHLCHVTQAEFAAEPPEHQDGNDLGGVPGPVQQAVPAFVPLFAAGAAAKPAIALGGAFRTFRNGH